MGFEVPTVKHMRLVFDTGKIHCTCLSTVDWIIQGQARMQTSVGLCHSSIKDG